VRLRSVLAIIALLGVWILLRENISVFTLVSGLVVSVITWAFCREYLPFGRIENVKLFPMLGYPIFLIWQIYAAGFFMIKLVFLGAEVEVIKVRTRLTNESLRIILVDSITMTPGSILLTLEGDLITLLWLKDPRKILTTQQRDEALKGDMERWLLKAEKD